MLRGVGWHARHIGLTDGSDCRDPGCPSFQRAATSVSTAYASADLSGTAWTGDKV